MKIYISGPMTGIPEWNRPEFDRVAFKLRFLGHEVFSPPEMDQGKSDGKWDDYLMRDLELLRTNIDAVCRLKDWEKSSGARIEVAFAKRIGLKMVSENGSIQIDNDTLASPGKIIEVDDINKVMQSGGRKDDNNKARYDLVPPEGLAALVDVYSFGSKKYDDRNWEKGIKYSRIFGATQRHLWAFWKGEWFDSESHCPHLASAAWGCFALLTYDARGMLSFDDRRK